MALTKTSGGFRFKRPTHYKSRDVKSSQENPPFDTVQNHTPTMTQNPSDIIQRGAVELGALPRSPESDGEDSHSAIHLDILPKTASHMHTPQTKLKAPVLVQDKAIISSPNQTRVKIPFNIDYQTIEHDIHELLQPEDEKATINGFLYRINGGSEYHL